MSSILLKIVSHINFLRVYLNLIWIIPLKGFDLNVMVIIPFIEGGYKPYFYINFLKSFINIVILSQIVVN